MEQSTFEKVACKLRRRAIQTSRNYGAGDADAEDIAQDVMLRLWQMREDLYRFHSLEALTVQIAKHLTLNQLRRKRLIVSNHDACLNSASVHTPVELMEECENELWLNKRLKDLPSTQYSVLYMRQVEHRHCKEIAGLLGIEETSVRTLLSRARKTLYEQLKKRNK